MQRFFLFWRHGCSAARKGRSPRCLHKCRFLYIDTSPALSARHHLTAALRYSARPPQRPSRSYLGCQTHQTYYFRIFRAAPAPWVACCAHQVQNFDLSQRFWCRGLWGVGFNEQSFGADEPRTGGKATKKHSALRDAAGRKGPNSTSIRSANLPRPSMAGAFSTARHGRPPLGAPNRCD